MRLIRLTQQPTGISEDIRAALASIGRGATVVGGVALVGVEAPGGGQLVDAVVILPKGVLIVTGVNLPDPAMRLQAPLGEQWKADGWPLVRTDGMVNPAVEALRLAGSVAERLRECGQGDAADISIGTIVAVGPYVETVEQPPDELAGTVRVLHPTATSMLAATVSLTRAAEPCTVSRVREFITVLAPTAQLPSEHALVAEGFTGEEPATQRLDAPRAPAEHLRWAESTVPADPPSPQAERDPEPAVEPAPTAPAAQADVTQPDLPAVPARRPQATPAYPSGPRRGAKRDGTDRTTGSATVRWLPIGAVGLLGCLLVAAIIVASLNSGGSPTAAPPASTSTTQPGSTVDGIFFHVRASASTKNCTAHAFGDVRTALRASDCLRLRRSSFTALVDGRLSAITIAVLGFPEEQQAKKFKKLADTPGTGGIRDLATQRKTWPGTAPRFAGAAYSSAIDGATVRLVRTDWFQGRSEPTDPALVKAARAALELPLPG